STSPRPSQRACLCQLRAGIDRWSRRGLDVLLRRYRRLRGRFLLSIRFGLSWIVLRLVLGILFLLPRRRSRRLSRGLLPFARICRSKPLFITGLALHDDRLSVSTYFNPVGLRLTLRAGYHELQLPV